MLNSFWPSLKAGAVRTWMESFKLYKPENVKKAIRDIYRHSENTYHPALGPVLEQIRGMEPKKLEKSAGIKMEVYLKKKGIKQLKDLI